MRPSTSAAVMMMTPAMRVLARSKRSPPPQPSAVVSDPQLPGSGRSLSADALATLDLAAHWQHRPGLPLRAVSPSPPRVVAPRLRKSRSPRRSQFLPGCSGQFAGNRSLRVGEFQRWSLVFAFLVGGCGPLRRGVDDEVAANCRPRPDRAAPARKWSKPVAQRGFHPPSGLATGEGFFSLVLWPWKCVVSRRNSDMAATPGVK